MTGRRFWIGMAISAALLALFFVTVDLRGMWDSLRTANYWFVALGLVAYLFAVVFRTLRWQVMLRHMRPVGVRRLFPVVVVGYMANNLLPMRLGELVRSYYVGEREGISKTSALATIFVERVLDALTLLFFVFAISLFVPLTGLAKGFGERFGVAWPLLLAVVSVPFVALFAMLLLFAWFPAKTRAVTTSLTTPLPQQFRGPLRNLVVMFQDGLAGIGNPRTLALLFLLSVPVWLLESVLFYCVGLSFGLNHVYANLGELAVAMVLVTALANVGSSIPSTPGGIGLFEIVARETLVLLPLASVDRSVAAGFAALVHAALLLPMIVMGQVFLWVEQTSLGRLSRGDRTNTSQGTGRQHVAATPPVDAKEDQ